MTEVIIEDFKELECWDEVALILRYLREGGEYTREQFVSGNVVYV